MNDVNDRNSITTNTTSAEDNERLIEELRKTFQGQKGDAPDALKSHDNANARVMVHDNVNHPRALHGGRDRVH